MENQYFTQSQHVKHREKGEEGNEPGGRGDNTDFRTLKEVSLDAAAAGISLPEFQREVK